MRRFVTVVALLFFTIPFGISISGCGKKTAVQYCTGDSGQAVGQVQNINLGPKIYGVSINQAEITALSNPSATDCKGGSVSVGSYTWGTTDMTLADVQPTSGRLCGGTWNKNSGGGVADYTVCNPTGKSGIAYITAAGGGATSNPLPVYVHPVVTSVVLGAPSTNCQTDPATNCSPAATNSNLPASAAVSCPVDSAYGNGCCSTTDAAAATIATSYIASGCLSQRQTGQFAARVYAGPANNQTNISCLVGHLSYAAQSAGIVSIDQNGVATAQQPGSTIIDATVALSGSSAGFFSTCPPTDISLSYPGSATGTTNIIVNQNNNQPITATVLDANGTSLTGLALEYVSTTPITIPAASNGTVTPTFPGEAAITAVCQPPSCNTAPQSLIGVYGNGKPVTSKEVTITAPGTNSTVLYVASTDSQYITPVDFTQTQIGAPVRLPYVPTSMVISNDGASLYLGSTTELMVLNTNSVALTKQDITVRGNVLAISPDNSTVVISDPVRQQVYLYSSAGSILTTYGGVGTRAQWSPDSQTVYIAAGNQILVYSRFSGWKQISPATTAGTAVSDVAVTVPAVGAYFAGPTTTARGYCPATTQTGTGNPPSVSNTFYPPADSAAVVTDRLAATSDGLHILGVSAANLTLSDIEVSLASAAATTLSASGGIICPAPNAAPGSPQNVPGLTFTNTVAPTVLTQIAPTAITGVLPTSDSRVAFITYTGTGGFLPAYQPSSTLPTSGVAIPGKVKNIPLSGTAIAPVAGAISADNGTLYVGTSGDALIHLIDTKALTDDPTKSFSPNLPSISGGTGALAVPNLLVEKPRTSGT